jgi:hypothetical protein
MHHMGAIWELFCLPYGSRLFAIWELCASRMGAILHHIGAKVVPTVRQICKLSAPYEAICAVRELLALYGSHMGVVWEPCGTMLNPCALYVPYGSHQACDRSHMHHMGALGCHMGGVCNRIEAKCNGWEQYTLDGSRMVPFGGLMLYGSSIAPCES